MGLEGTGRGVLGFLLVGLVLICGTNAQNHLATVSPFQISSKVPSAKPSIAEAPHIRPSPSDSPSLSESPSLPSNPSLGPSLNDKPSHVPSKSPSRRPSLSYASSARKQPSHLPETSYEHNNFEESSAEHHLIPFHAECVAHVVHINRGDSHKTELSCSLMNGLSYPIPSIGEEWIEEQMILGELISAETRMTLPSDAMVNQYTHEIHIAEPPKLWNYGIEEREQRRQLRRLATTGTKTVLVVRIQATDATTTPTATELGNQVFGDDGNDYNLKYQTEACSHNQLIINKASDRAGSSTSISGGLVTVSVSVATSVGVTPFQNAVTTALNTQFSVSAPSDLANHVMYCYPTGVTEAGVVAFAVVNGYLSFYNDAACTYPSAQIHEIGHNYNMGHSSDSTDEYGDQSGLMGFSYENTDIPKMCFNAAKSWQLGWYSSKADSISPSLTTDTTYSTRLAGIVDYSATFNKCLIEIQQSTSTTYYYVNYNRATGINDQPLEGGNQVLVVSKDTSAETNISMALAALDAGQSFAISNFNGNSGETLTITFTSLESNEANVNIALTVAGPSTSASPSLSDSPSLSSNPTLGPSLSNKPSQAPSIRPSLSFVPSASEQPSHLPSKLQTISTSPSTSEAPSLSETPSIIPSQAPSVSSVPSDLSSKSNAPSKSPSKMPSRSLSPFEAPSVSYYPSLRPSTNDSPTTSLEPTTSTQPTGEKLRPIVEWKMLVANRFARAFSDVVEIGDTTTTTTTTTNTDDSDSDTIVITATNTTSLRVMGAQTSQPVLAMTGQSTIELDEWVDVSNYEKVQMLFWFYARRNQANVESDRFAVEYLNRTTTGGEGTWVTLKTYQRGRGRFRRNNQWYLGRVIISTLDLEGVLFRFQSFFPSSTKMVLLDKFGILGFAKEGMTTLSETEADKSQQRGVPNRSHPIRGKTTNMTVDSGWLSEPLV